MQLCDYLELVYLVTALVPSDTACLASSPGRSSLTAVWISREVIVDLQEGHIYIANIELIFTACCSEPTCLPLQQSARTSRWQRSSWWTWPWRTHPCRDALASAPIRFKTWDVTSTSTSIESLWKAPCRWRNHKIPASSSCTSSSSCRPRRSPWWSCQTWHGSWEAWQC